MADARGLAAGGKARLATRREIARLRRLAPGLRARCRALAALGVPVALDHGDLWAVNVVVGRRGPVFLDWEDAVLSHPFWGAFMLPWSQGFWDRWGHRGPAAERLREAYLAGWAGRDGVERYREAFALSRALAPLHHAAIWRRDVIPILETSLETAALLPSSSGACSRRTAASTPRCLACARMYLSIASMRRPSASFSVRPVAVTDG